MDLMDLTVALPKGRLLEPSLEMLSRAGITVDGITNESRRLVHDIPQKLALTAAHEGGTQSGAALGSLRFLVVRPSDVPVYVEYGAADLGIVGKDVLMEHQRDVYELLDLGFGRCRFVVAAPRGVAPSLRQATSGEVPPRLGPPGPEPPGRESPGLDLPAPELPGLERIAQLSPIPVRVATKFPNVARRYFRERGVVVEVIPLHGATELAPIVGLAQVVVDITSTGRTLAENDLVVVEEIAASTARLVANRASFRLRSAEVDAVVQAVAGACGQGGGRS